MGKIFFLENGATNYIRLFPVIKKKKKKKKKRSQSYGKLFLKSRVVWNVPTKNKINRQFRGNTGLGNT